MVTKMLRRGLILLLILFVAPVLANPDIQSWSTKNGARVLFVAAPEIPMLDVRVVFDAGSARSEDQPGLSTLTNAMLSEGAGDWSADQIAERLESVGASLSTGALRDMAWVGIRSLTEQKALDVALGTQAAMIAQPRFAGDDLERLRKAMLVSLSQDEQSPGSVASKAFYRQLFGDHPYAIDSDGTKASVEKLNQQDLVNFHKRYYVAKNATLALVGAISRQQAEQIAERLVGGLLAGERPAPLPAVKALTKAGTQKIDFPSTQSHVLVGQPGMKRGDPDYFALYVGNHILGGSGLVSILSDEIREQRGLSYSVYSYFSPMREMGPFQMGFQTKTDQASEALKVLRDTLSRFIEQGPSEAQLKAARDNITGGFPLRIASNSKIVEYISMIGFYDLPLDYLDKFTQRVEAVTVKSIRDAFKRRVHPDRLVTVIVGQQVE